jgi:uncharacterized membrane protein
MSKSRIEAFTDAVIAIVMTILVLEFEPPESAEFAVLWEMRSQFLIYLISFITLAIYWCNHHHLFQIAKTVSGAVLWLNILLLLAVSLIPFTTAYVDNFLFDLVPELAYGGVMLAADVVWLFLARALVKENGKSSAIASAIAGSKKSWISIGLIAAGMIAGIFAPIAIIISCVLSLIPWVIPDKKIERLLHESRNGK